MSASAVPAELCSCVTFVPHKWQPTKCATCNKRKDANSVGRKIVDAKSIFASSSSSSSSSASSAEPAAAPKVVNIWKKPAPAETPAETKPAPIKKEGSTTALPSGFGSQVKCSVCDKTVYPNEKLVAEKVIYHKNCFRCEVCKKVLSLGDFASLDGSLFCKPHLKQKFAEKGRYDFGKDSTQSSADAAAAAILERSKLPASKQAGSATLPSSTSAVIVEKKGSNIVKEVYKKEVEVDHHRVVETVTDTVTISPDKTAAEPDVAKDDEEEEEKEREREENVVAEAVTTAAVAAAIVAAATEDDQVAAAVADAVADAIITADVTAENEDNANNNNNNNNDDDDNTVKITDQTITATGTDDDGIETHVTQHKVTVTETSPSGETVEETVTTVTATETLPGGEIMEETEKTVTVTETSPFGETVAETVSTVTTTETFPSGATLEETVTTVTVTETSQSGEFVEEKEQTTTITETSADGDVVEETEKVVTHTESTPTNDDDNDNGNAAGDDKVVTWTCSLCDKGFGDDDEKIDIYGDPHCPSCRDEVMNTKI